MARRSFRSRVKDPLIVDRRQDVAFILLWLIYAAWGISATIAKIPTLTKAATPFYENVWGISIGVAALVAGIAGISTFFDSPSIRLRIRKKQAELWAVCVLGGFGIVYPGFLFIQVLFANDSTRLSLAIFALSFLVMPTLRVRQLSDRVEALRKLLRAQSA